MGWGDAGGPACEPEARSLSGGVPGGERRELARQAAARDPFWREFEAGLSGSKAGQGGLNPEAKSAGEVKVLGGGGRGAGLGNAGGGGVGEWGGGLRGRCLRSQRLHPEPQLPAPGGAAQAPH